MSEITVEDCLKVIPNRFELVLLASYRAKTLMNGSPALYQPGRNDKNTIIALHEIGKKLINIEEVKDITENNIKNQNFLKNYDDSNLYSDKKDTVSAELLDMNGDDEVVDGKEIGGEEEEEEDEDAYYESLDKIPIIEDEKEVE